MFLAEEAAKATTNSVDPFDYFVIAFTIALIWAVFRTIKSKEKNKFAIGFAVVSLVVFLLMDWVMVQHWMGNM